jgi:hypothetical protein
MLNKMVRYITLIPLSLYLIYCLGYMFTHEARPEYLDCGEIVSKSSDEVAIKHGIQTELYLNIEFDSTWFESIEVSPTTYFEHDVGERICFNLNAKPTIWHYVNQLVGYVLAIIGCVVLLILFIFELAPDSWWNDW